MFLQDLQRTNRSPKLFCAGIPPQKKWVITLPSLRPSGIESTPIEDNNGNYYFGCHDGHVYCAHNLSGVRWSCYTSKKVYSSASWVNEERFVIASGSGNLLCFKKCGDLVWKYDICSGYENVFKERRYWILFQMPFLWDASMRKFQVLKCWSSPIVSDNVVLITGFGVGLHAVDVNSGKALWTHFMGWPAFHRAGVAISGEGEIFVASQHRDLWKLDNKGKILWHEKIGPLMYEAWANPSIDDELDQVYCIWTSSRGSSFIFAVGKGGEIRWKTKIPSIVRGSAGIGYNDSIYFVAFDGNIYKLNRQSGRVICKKKIASSKRGLWTTPLILPNGKILVTTKSGSASGCIKQLSPSLRTDWSIEIGKAFMVPLINSRNEIVVGSWRGQLYGLGL